MRKCFVCCSVCLIVQSRSVCLSCRFTVSENWIRRPESQQCMGCSPRTWNFQSINLPLQRYRKCALCIV